MDKIHCGSRGLYFIAIFFGISENSLCSSVNHMFSWPGASSYVEVGRTSVLHVKKMKITFSPDRGPNLVRWTQKSYTIPRRYKSRILLQVQVCYIPISGDIRPSKLEFVPEFLGVRESGEMRLKEFYAHMGYLWWAPNVTWKSRNNIFPRSGGLKVLHSTVSL